MHKLIYNPVSLKKLIQNRGRNYPSVNKKNKTNIRSQSGRESDIILTNNSLETTSI